MKIQTIFGLIALVTIIFVVTGHSQGVLNAGDSLSYHFASMDDVGTQSFPSGGLLFSALFSFTVTDENTGGGLQSELTFDLFEGSPSGASFTSGNWLSGGSTQLGITTPAWQDLEGSVTFTVDSGSYLIDSFTFTVYQPTADPTIYNIMQTTVTPVPEPATLSLAALSFFSFGLFSFFRKPPPNTALEPTSTAPSVSTAAPKLERHRSILSLLSGGRGSALDR